MTITRCCSFLFLAIMTICQAGHAQQATPPQARTVQPGGDQVQPDGGLAGEFLSFGLVLGLLPRFFFQHLAIGAVPRDPGGFEFFVNHGDDDNGFL